MRQSIELVLQDEDEAMEGEADTEPDKQVSETIIPKRQTLRRKANES